MVTLRPYGRRAVLLEVGSAAQVPGLHARVHALDLPGVLDVVPAARTVLVTFADPGALALARPALAEVTAEVTDRPTGGAVVTVDVTYDGPDLAAVAADTGLTVAEVIARHTAPAYTVGFIGFAPGFAYLIGLDPVLHVPRHASPRTRVPAGSVGIAGEFTGVYPRASPGGRQLLGRTNAALWDLARERPALLEPGVAVRFREVR